MRETMRNAMEKFDKNMDELMDLCKREAGKSMLEDSMYSDEGLRAMRMAFNLADAAMELMKAQNNLLIDMHTKMDKMEALMTK